jgi:hypothetical protein
MVRFRIIRIISSPTLQEQINPNQIKKFSQWEQILKAKSLEF